MPQFTFTFRMATATDGKEEAWTLFDKLRGILINSTLQYNSGLLEMDGKDIPISQRDWDIQETQKRVRAEQSRLREIAHLKGRLSELEAVGETSGSWTYTRKRTKAEVIAAKKTMQCCCNRHADYLPCDCLEEAE